MAGSLLAHLYSRIKGSQEDVATISLQYIISSSNKLNEAFNNLLNVSLSLKTPLDSDTRYSCQAVGDNKERPDMSGVDSNGNEVILCEMKFYAGLTSNQPDAYIDRLIKEGGKALVFVCPEKRKTSLWKEVKVRCIKAGKELADENGYRIAVDGITMAVITWSEIIKALRIADSSDDHEHDIAQLEGLCDLMDSTAFIPFKPEDLGSDMARYGERYYQVIDRLFDKLIDNKTIRATAEGLRATPNRSGYTRYIKINNYDAALVYSRTAWMNKNTAETPFWFYINDVQLRQSEKLITKMRTISDYETVMLGGSEAIALYAPTDVQLDEIAEIMMEQIVKFIRFIEE